MMHRVRERWHLTVKVVVLVPAGHVVIAIAASHDTIINELCNLESGADGGCGSGRLEEGTGQVGGLEDAGADDLASIEELLSVGLAGPASSSEAILHPQVWLVANFE